MEMKELATPRPYGLSGLQPDSYEGFRRAVKCWRGTG